jgi:hypothetical protein
LVHFGLNVCVHTQPLICGIGLFFLPTFGVPSCILGMGYKKEIPETLPPLMGLSSEAGCHQNRGWRVWKYKETWVIVQQ